MIDPLAGSAWSAPATVAGFASSPPNPVLTAFAKRELAAAGGRVALDIGCGAARNAVPLAQMGWEVIGLDLSRPMIEAASRRAAAGHVGPRVRLLLAAADALPVAGASVDLIVAHGVWNLLPSAAAFRRAAAEAARVARPGAALFVFTFSRHTLPATAAPVAGEQFVFTQFSGQPQCFLTETELVEEMDRAGFARHPGVALTEYNRRERSGLGGGPPVIYEAAFRRR